jgi:hypothetical protein
VIFTARDGEMYADEGSISVVVFPCGASILPSLDSSSIQRTGIRRVER